MSICSKSTSAISTRNRTMPDQRQNCQSGTAPPCWENQNAATMTANQASGYVLHIQKLCSDMKYYSSKRGTQMSYLKIGGVISQY